MIGTPLKITVHISYRVYRLVPSSEEHLEALQDLWNMEKFSFWQDPSTVGQPVDIMTSPEQESELLFFIDDLKINAEVMLEDLQRAIQEENQPLQDDVNVSSRARPARKVFFEKYHQIDAMQPFLDNLAAQYPNIVRTIDVGTSYEGRPLRGVRIGATQARRKSAIWIDAGIHAREWVAPATALYIISKLAEDYSTDPKIKRLVDEIDWYILPVANPDGYEYTHTHDRMWRKTRSRGSLFCQGVDPNRNWGHMWNKGGASNNPCSDIYAGPKPFSEKETTAIRDYILNIKDQIKVYLTFHSYSQMWLTPWGFTKSLPSNFDKLQNLAMKATASLSTKYGTRYVVGSSSNVLYIASGGSDDWAMGGAGIPYAYTVELRDKGQHGFILPAHLITPTAEETWDAIQVLGDEVIKGLP